MRITRLIYFALTTFFFTSLPAQDFQDNLDNEVDGDFPSKWALVKGSAEIRTFQGEKVIYFSNNAIIKPAINNNYLGDEFTLEFDAFFDEVEKSVGYQYYGIRFWDGQGAGKASTSLGALKLFPLKIFRYGASMDQRIPNAPKRFKAVKPELKTKEPVWKHIKIDYRTGKFKLFIDGDLILNIPKLAFPLKVISIEGVYNQFSKDFNRTIKNIQLFGPNIPDNTSVEALTENTEGSPEDTEELATSIHPISINEEGLSRVVFSEYENENSNSFTTEMIDDIVIQEMIRQQLPGLAIGVYQKGVIDYTKGYGHIDIDRTVPITSKTPMRWASISKTVTAVAALQLEQRSSAFSIDDTVIEHYPYWTSNMNGQEIQDKSRKETITLLDLLTNRSGIDHYGDGVWANETNYVSDDDNFNANSSVDVFKSGSLMFAPDSLELYSSQGFNLAGAVIDNVYAQGYPAFVKKYIADKLEMHSLKVSNTVMPGFQRKRDGIINSRNVSSKEWVLPGGGWQSNVEDLLKFARGILEGTLLPDSSKLWDDNRYRNNVYKLGIRIDDSGGPLRVHHGGTQPNLRTMMYVIPNSDIAIVVMIPMQSADRNNFIARIINKMNIGLTFGNIDRTPLDRCNSTMESTQMKFAGLWRKNSNDVLIRRGYATTNFNKEWRFLSANGYYLEDIETSTGDNGQLLWEGIFKKGNGEFAMWRNFDSAGFKRKWDEMRQMGYVLYDLETYTLNGNQRWAGLFKKQEGGNDMFRNLSFSEFAAIRSQMHVQGKQLIDIETYTINGQTRWSGVWIEGTAERLNRNVETTSSFNSLIVQQRSSGFKLIDIETYVENGVQKWAGIFVQNDDETKSLLRNSYCNIMDRHHNDLSNNGFELIDLESYNE